MAELGNSFSLKPGDDADEFPENPCIAAPFGRHKKRFLDQKSKKLAQNHLRLEEARESLKSGDKNDLCDLFLNYADRLCDVGRYGDSLCAYVQALASQRPDGQPAVDMESLIHFMLTISREISNVNKARARANVADEAGRSLKKSGFDAYKSLPGDPCPDPWSCPACSGVLVDPVTLPCGHTFCRAHACPDPERFPACPKCKNPLVASGEPDKSPVDSIKTNTLVNKLVTKYWTPDLEANEKRLQAKKHFSSGNLENALDLYNQAFKLAPGDYLTLGNRSLVHFKLGNYKQSLEDAEKALKAKPDWPKGHFRRGVALRSLGLHSAAFKAFFACLSLEDGLAKPVRQELTAITFQLLEKAAQEAGAGSCRDDDDSTGSISTSSSTSSFATDNVSVAFDKDQLPSCLAALSNFLESRDEKAALQSDSWLIQKLVPFEKPFRHIDGDAVDATDYECPLCFRLFWQPVTTPCGHTFCKTCLDRVLDHNTTCPMCKSTTIKSFLADRRETFVNEFIESSMKRLLNESYTERRKIHDGEMRGIAGHVRNSDHVQMPIFVCTMGYPNIPCPLHVYEPRYRLMIRRCMESGTREFGMCCPSETNIFQDVGCVLEVRDIKYFPDGRSVVDTVGSRRFKVVNRSVVDGYNVATVEFIKDDTVPEDQLEDLKALHDETLRLTKDWFHHLKPQLQSEFLSHYGQTPAIEANYWTLPSGPSWPWWIMAILPIDTKLKLQIMSKTSLRMRLENIRRILRLLSQARAKK